MLPVYITSIYSTVISTSILIYDQYQVIGIGAAGSVPKIYTYTTYYIHTSITGTAYQVKVLIPVPVAVQYYKYIQYIIYIIYSIHQY